MVNNDTYQETTPYQQGLLEQGWEYSNRFENEMTEGFGYEPEYGFVDNYFDIKLGDGSDCIIKIMDAKSDKCIRQTLVSGGSSTIVSQIPQKRVYLKIAYGKNLMELKTDSFTLCKFTTDTSYERSAIVFDFGKKNSLKIINYTLEIRVKTGSGENNLKTIPISEEDFNK